MQHSEVVIARQKNESQLSAESKSKAEDLYHVTLEKLLEVEQLLKKRQATALEL